MLGVLPQSYYYSILNWYYVKVKLLQKYIIEIILRRTTSEIIIAQTRLSFLVSFTVNFPANKNYAKRYYNFGFSEKKLSEIGISRIQV